MSELKICELAYEGKLGELKYLLDKEPSLIHKADKSGRTSLHWAIAGGRDDIVDFLFQQCEDMSIDLRDESNWTPLMIAASAGRTQIVRNLISKQAQVNAVNSTGQCSLHYAASKDRFEIAETLLENGADPNIADNVKNTPLHRAASKGHVKMTKLLLSFNADVNFQDSEGNSALHLACEDGEAEIVKLLVDHGGSLSLQNKAEKTPIELTAPGNLRVWLRTCEEGVNILSYLN